MGWGGGHSGPKGVKRRLVGLHGAAPAGRTAVAVGADSTLDNPPVTTGIVAPRRRRRYGRSDRKSEKQVTIGKRKKAGPRGHRKRLYTHVDYE